MVIVIPRAGQAFDGRGKAMSGRAEQLAGRFRHATEEVIDFVAPLSEAQWRAVDPDEGLSIGAIVHHLAAGNRLARGVLAAMAGGAEWPSHHTEAATEDRQRLRAQGAAEFAHLSRAEATNLLRYDGSEAAETIRGLSDEGLERVHWVWGEAVRPHEFVERWIEDIYQHLAEIRTTARDQSPIGT